MKCDNCGKEFHRGEPTYTDTHGDRKSAGRFGGSVEVERLLLCQDCAASRRSMTRYFVIVFCIVFGAIGLLSILLHW
jgi:hypothetical protein